jgi:hypothetical protein
MAVDGGQEKEVDGSRKLTCTDERERTIVWRMNIALGVHAELI